MFFNQIIFTLFGKFQPETQKLNTIIEKTASFIASHGTQMQILLKAKQSGNPQFEFLSLECPLHAYYNFILTAIKEGRHKLQEDPKEGKFLKLTAFTISFLLILLMNICAALRFHRN